MHLQTKNKTLLKNDIFTAKNTDGKGENAGYHSIPTMFSKFFHLGVTLTPNFVVNGMQLTTCPAKIIADSSTITSSIIKQP